jgi:hypothetical protein
MKNIFFIFLFGFNSALHAQELSAPVNLREIKPSVGEWITEAPVKNIVERTYRLSSYQTPDGGNGFFLKYDQPGAIIPQAITKKSIQMKVIPNPSNGLFTVIINDNHSAVGQLFIHDILGIISYYSPQSNSKVFDVDLSMHSTGIYLIRYVSKDSEISERIIKL